MKEQQVQIKDEKDEFKEPPKRKRRDRRNAKLFSNGKLDLELGTQLKELKNPRSNLHTGLIKARNQLMQSLPLEKFKLNRMEV